MRTSVRINDRLCSAPSLPSSRSPPADRAELLQVPAALAPAVGGVQLVGECSPAAEAFGIHTGMKLGEALARCPRLTLVPPDPAGVADAWERILVRLGVDRGGGRARAARARLLRRARSAAPPRPRGDLSAERGARRRTPRIEDAGSLRRRSLPLRRGRGRVPGAGPPADDRPQGGRERARRVSSRPCR